MRIYAVFYKAWGISYGHPLIKVTDYIINTQIITARKRHCGKVLFSQTSVILFVRKGLGTSHASWDRSHGGVSRPAPPDIRPEDPPMLLTSNGHHWRCLQTCSLEDLPLPVLTSSGGYQADGTHPTGMLSCYFLPWHLGHPMSSGTHCPRSLRTPSARYPCWVQTALSAEPPHLHSQETKEK